MGTFVGNVLIRLSIAAQTVEEFLVASWLTMASDVLDIPLGLVVISLASELHRRQAARHRRLSTAGP